jgi:hypothetical protein
MGFLKYEDVLIEVAGESVFASEASINVSASLEPVRLADGTVHRYAPSNGMQGQLSFSHYLTGSLASFLDVTGVSEAAVVGTFGGLSFGDAYLNSLSFSVEPYSPILVESSFNFYGSLSNSISSSYDVDLEKTKHSHAIKSFVAGTPANMNYNISFDYSMKAQRNPVLLAGETTPTRVTKQAVDINMNIVGDNIGNNLTFNGEDVNLKCSIYDINNSSALQNFYCSGRITSQELGVSNQGYLNGAISAIQSYQ